MKRSRIKCAIVLCVILKLILFFRLSQHFFVVDRMRAYFLNCLQHNHIRRQMVVRQRIGCHSRDIEILKKKTEINYIARFLF